MPKSSRHLGRVQVVNAGVARETQVIFYTSREAREWALSGVVARISESALSGSQVARVTGHHTPDHLGKQAVTVTALPGPVTLREACDPGGDLSCSIESARMARHRGPEFPPAIGIRDGSKTYDPAALVRWERNRPRSRDEDDTEAEGS